MSHIAQRLDLRTNLRRTRTLAMKKSLSRLEILKLFALADDQYYLSVVDSPLNGTRHAVLFRPK